MLASSEDIQCHHTSSSCNPHSAQNKNMSTLSSRIHSLSRSLASGAVHLTPATTTAWIEGPRANSRLTPPATGSSTTTRLYSSTSNNAASEEHSLSSKRAQRAVQLLPSYLADARNVEQYHPETAPQGALQLGVAESKLLEDMLVPALNTPISLTPDCIYYQPTHGRPACRQAMASYATTMLDLPPDSLDVDGIVVGAGCNAVLENMCMCLAEEGEAVMIPTPYYAAFEFDLVARINLHVQPVQTQTYSMDEATSESTASSSSDSDSTEASLNPLNMDPSVYYPTVAALDAAYEQSMQAGHAPKILLLSHPHNPLGVCYPKNVLQECIDWCRANKVHLISDEIYAGSVYKSNEAGFESILKVASSDNAKKDETGLGLGPYVHWVYALSKDFALSGLRVGMAYSENPAIRVPMQKLNDLCQISSQTQEWVAAVMKKEVESGKLWPEHFREENHKRLRARCEALQACLEECNIPYLTPTSGLFCWINMSEFLPTEGTDSERERALYLELVNEFGLLFTPADSMRNEEPGFFRIVFTAATDEEFNLGLQRLRRFAAAKGSI